MRRIGEAFAIFVRRRLPDPMVIACLLTMLTAAMAVLIPFSPTHLPRNTLRVSQLWFAGLWNPGFLVFAVQMCLVLLTGFALARAPAATRFLDWLAARVASERAAVVLVAGVSCVGCWINWGFGLIAAGVLAMRVRDVLASRGHPCRFALLVAAAYSGMMIWHGGLSGSAPLRVAKEGVEVYGTDGETRRLPPIPVTRTLFTVGNLALTGVVFVGVPLVFSLLSGRRTNATELNAPAGSPTTPGESSWPDASRVSDETNDGGWAERLNRARWIPLAIAVALATALGGQLSTHGPSAIDLNFVNSTFLMLGLALHRNLYEFVQAVAEGGRAISGIVIQFPLYSGIQSIMLGSGLAASLSQGFVITAAGLAEILRIDPAGPFALATLLSAGLINFFVPSGGGQWIVQGPILCGAAETLGVSVERTVMGIAYGDQWTNMAQPFWAIPLMGLTGVNVRQFMGYCMLLMLLAGPVFAIAAMI